MRVLLMGTDTGEDSVATKALRREGHEVVRCHPPDAPAFPCAALVEGWTCPLEGDAVAAAVVVGAGTDHQVDVGAEEGSRCALRMHVPLVTVGYHYASPLVPWAAEAVTRPDDIGPAVDRAIRAPLRAHETAGTEAFRQVLETHEIPDAEARVIVTRQDRGLRAELVTDADLPTRTAETAAVRVLAALRTVDPHAASIGVTIGNDVLLDTAAG